jgi:hypothetical protein
MIIKVMFLKWIIHAATRMLQGRKISLKYLKLNGFIVYQPMMLKNPFTVMNTPNMGKPKEINLARDPISIIK